MMRPVEMAKVKIVALKKDMPKIISELHEQGIIHIKKFSAKEFEESKVSELHSKIVEQLLRVESMCKLIKAQKQHHSLPSKPIESILSELEQFDLDKKLQKLQDEKSKLQDERAALLDKKSKLEYFKDFHTDFSKLQSQSIDLYAALLPTKQVHLARVKFDKISKHYESVSKPYSKEKSVMVIAVEKKFSDKFRQVLFSANSQELPLDIEGRPKEAIFKINQHISIANDKLKQIDSEFEKLSKLYWGKLQYFKEALTIEKERNEIPSKFGKTSDLIGIEGWVPDKNLHSLDSALKTAIGPKFLLNEEHVHGHEEFPILLSNSKPLSPFEFLVGFITLPKSHDYDPTLLFALIFPIFYGMMLGDAGYGLVSLLLALFIVKKTSPDGMLNPIGKVWAYCSVPAIIFGIVFDEFFGFSHTALIGKTLYHGLERMHSIEVLMPATILVGVGTISLGFFLGFLNALHEKEYWHAFAKLGWVGVVLSGTFLIPGVLFNAFSGEIITIAGAIFIGSLIPILKAEGPMGLIEIPGVAGNILSFSRILAVGLSSVIVAMILNDLLFPKLEQGLLLIVTLPLFIIGHFFNIVLGMFESLVQGARLNYVEFFSKFFQGGGERFMPFKCVRLYTKRR